MEFYLGMFILINVVLWVLVTLQQRYLSEEFNDLKNKLVKNKVINQKRNQ